MSLERILAILKRYLILHKRSLPRTFEIVFWPVMELLVWGFVSVYLQSMAAGTLGNLVSVLISAMVFWDILDRSQQAVSIAIIEDIWTQNIVNILVSPLRIREWLAATFIYGLLKTAAITIVLAGIAFALYRYSLTGTLGFYLLPLVANLLLFGWAVGVMTSGLVIRWGHSAEALIWGIPYLLQPISSIYYPVTVLPRFVQKISWALPSTYVFEGVRQVARHQMLPADFFWKPLALNAVYFVIAGLLFRKMYESARKAGRLGRLGGD